MRYRTTIKTPDGEIKRIGHSRNGPKDIEEIRRVVLNQQNTFNRRTGASYMPQGEILSIEVVPDSEPVKKVVTEQGAEIDPRNIGNG